MKILGLTGGIGMGKTTAGAVLSRLGCRVVDTDAVSRELTEPGQPALIEICTAFGSDSVDGDGSLRRDYLAQRVFSDPQERRKLEAILHPRIRERWRSLVEGWRRQGEKLAVVIIPLLFETDAARDVDVTVCVCGPEALQRRRLAERGWSQTQIQQRAAAQLPIRRKMELADFVVWNCAGMELLEAQLAHMLRLAEVGELSRAPSAETTKQA